MLTAINQRLSVAGRRSAREESGFTLIELLVVLVIIGVLLAIAVPSYLGFKKRAEKQTSNSNVRAGIPALEAYYSDNGNYSTTLAVLKASYDSGLASGLVVTPGVSTYTIAFTQGSCTASVTGPGGTITNTC